MKPITLITITFLLFIPFLFIFENCGEDESEVNQLPTVTTADITDIGDNSATGGGEVTDNGGLEVTARGVVWSETSSPTVVDNDGFTENGTGLGTFTSSLTSLTMNTTYYVRAYATNSAGTAYGDPVYFKTPPGLPILTTADVTNIGAYIATVGCEITDDGGASNVYPGILWSTTPNPTLESNEGTMVFKDNPFEGLLSGLDPETTYYVRAYTLYMLTTVVYGEEKSFTTLPFSETVQTGSFTDPRDNTVYNTVTINGQNWMAENLAFLPDVCPPDSECGYWVYDYEGADQTEATATSNYTTYGVLYNWETAKASCPAGWHLPSSDEWSFLEMNLGMPDDIAFIGIDISPRGVDEGGKIKETGTIHWNAPNTGATNISGFTALPGGYRLATQNIFEGLGSTGWFWTSSSVEVFPILIIRHVSSDSPHIEWVEGPPENGYSVRCVED